MKKKVMLALLCGAVLVMQTACTGEADESATETTVSETTVESTAVETTTEGASDDVSAETSVEEVSDASLEADTEVFTSVDGWSITYDKNLFALGEIDEHTTQFSYLGEAGGANVMTVEYTEDKTPEEAFAEKKESWSGTLRAMDTTFPTTEDKMCYCLMGLPEEDAIGMYETWYIAEYNGGTLILDLLSFNSGNDEIDMEVSDNTSALLYSLTFDNFEEQKNFSSATADEYVGEWAESTAERVVATVTKSEDGSGYDIEITWREDLPQKDVYTMHVDGEDPEQWFYADGLYVIRTFTDDGNYTDEVQYEDGTGMFYLCKADGLLYWTDYSAMEQVSVVTTFKAADFE